MPRQSMGVQDLVFFCLSSDLSVVLITPKIQAPRIFVRDSSFQILTNT